MNKKTKSKTEKAADNAPAIIDNALVPKPKKAELIEALARREMERQEREYRQTAEENEAMRVKLEKAVTAFALKRVRQMSASVELGYKSYADGLSGVSVKFSYLEKQDMPESLKSELASYCSRKRPTRPCLSDIRRMIRAGFVSTANSMTREARINALLSDEKVTAVFDQMLDDLRKPTVPAITAQQPTN